jgi:DNA-binding HxlR family transcriptional regulator
MTPDVEACGIEELQEAFALLEGRWKLLLLNHLFLRSPQRFSELERATPGISQKMLIQQLKALERDGLVARHAYPVVPPHVEYALTPAGVALQPALVALRDWAVTRSVAQAPGRRASDRTSRISPPSTATARNQKAKR